jgi:hypothetical protein
MRKRITAYIATCNQLLNSMDAHEEAQPLQLNKATRIAQRAEYLLMYKFKYRRSQVRVSLDQILQQRKLRAAWLAMRKQLSSSSMICKQVLDWMVVHDDALPSCAKHPSTIGRRVERDLRGRFNYLKRKTDRDLARVIHDKIFKQRSGLAAKCPLRKCHSPSTTNCNKVFKWMDVNEVMFPAMIKKLTIEAQRAEFLLRRQCKYLMNKINISPEARAVLEQIENGLDASPKSPRSGDSDTTTCMKVLEWMDSHKTALPKEYRKPTSDTQRAEYRLRNKFKNLKRKTDHLPIVRALLDKIELCSSKEPDLKLCVDVFAWLGAHENVLPLERKVFGNNGERDECCLARRWRGFKRRKTCTSEARTLFDMIENRTLQSTVPAHCKGEGP